MDADVVAAKLKELTTRVARVRQHAKSSADALKSDQDALDIVSLNLMVAVQACADIGSHIIADEQWEPPSTVAESFERLAEHGVISKAVATSLRRASSFRNVIAHGYAAVDVGAVHAASTAGLSDLDAFAREVAAWTASHAAR